MIKLIIPGPPVGKARVRITKWGAHTPEKTVNYETQIKERFASEYPDQIPTEKAVWMDIEIYHAIPKSTSKKKKALMLENKIRPAKKPDIDNIAKICSDALNGIAYKDDNQIVTMSLRKYYSERPRVEINVIPL